jgi:adenine-specific DNA methylase
MRNEMSIMESPLIYRDIPFPRTRYQGSKYKLLNWFYSIFNELKFDTVLDTFGGTGAVSHLFKKMKKQVTYNDILVSNWYIGKALVENRSIRFDLSRVSSLFAKKNGIKYRTIIQDHFKDIYYTDEENKLLDIVVQNILEIDKEYEKALCLFALFQACIQKRPFNLFHRKNLNLRLNKVERTFGNLKTWNTPFPVLFQRALKEGNRAVFDNCKTNEAINYSILSIPTNGSYDLVYLDPPYVSKEGIGVNYRSFYHFLEGICNYHEWEKMIDKNSKHKSLHRIPNGWSNSKNNILLFEKAITEYKDSIIVISYRDPGLPAIETLKTILSNYKSKININRKKYKYALSSKRNKGEEVLIIAKN